MANHHICILPSYLQHRLTIPERSNSYLCLVAECECFVRSNQLRSSSSNPYVLWIVFFYWRKNAEDIVYVIFVYRSICCVILNFLFISHPLVIGLGKLLSFRKGNLCSYRCSLLVQKISGKQSFWDWLLREYQCKKTTETLTYRN